MHLGLCLCLSSVCCRNLRADLLTCLSVCLRACLFVSCACLPNVQQAAQAGSACMTCLCMIVRECFIAGSGQKCHWTFNLWQCMPLLCSYVVGFDRMRL